MIKSDQAARVPLVWGAGGRALVLAWRDVNREAAWAGANPIRKWWDWGINPCTGSAVAGKAWMQLGHPQQEFLPEHLGLMEPKLGSWSISLHPPVPGTGGKILVSFSNWD